MSEEATNGISDTMKAMVLYSLHNSKKTSITFTKVDGTERTMLCTLHESLVPASNSNDSGEKKRKTSVGIQIVWDLEAGDWRSFRWDSLKSFSSLDNREEIATHV